MDPEDARAEGVEGRDPHPPGIGAYEEGHPVLHLAGSLVGEGYGKDLFGRGKALIYEVGDTMRKHARLPAPCTGEYEERPSVCSTASSWVGFNDSRSTA